jgi:hypothetical protein
MVGRRGETGDRLQKSLSKPDGWGTKKVENLAASRIADERDA